MFEYLLTVIIHLMTLSQDPLQPQSAKVILETHLLKLTTLVRERESHLVMLLEEKRQKEWSRPEWLLKECQYQEKECHLSREIRRIIMYWVLLNDDIPQCAEYNRIVGNFWLKLKITIKMSLDQVKVLDLLSEPLFRKYEAIIEQINCGFDKYLGIVHYRSVEELLKNRNRQLHQILSQSKIITPILLRKLSDCQSNRLNKQSNTGMRSNKLLSLTKRKGQFGIEWKLMRRPMSHHSKHKRPICNREVLKPKKVKKLNQTLDHLESNVYSVMGMKIDVNIDKKKGLKANLEALYQQLLQKNNRNQKEITKFVLNQAGRKIKPFTQKKGLKMFPKLKLRLQSAKIDQSKQVKSKSIVKCKHLNVAKLKKKLKLVEQKEAIKPYDLKLRKSRKCL